jgi:hypothetical protein
MTINFNENYNNKLSNKYILTIRKQDEKFKEGEIYKVLINHKYQFKVKIVSLQMVRFGIVSDMALYLDTGMEPPKAKKLFYSFGIKDEDMVMFIILERLDYDYEID